MTTPTSRQTLKDYALRALGNPVITVNVSDDQLEDRLDDAFKMFRDWHHAGMTRGYLKYQLQHDDIANEYFIIPDNVIEVTKILPYNSSVGGALFSPIPFAKYTYMFNFNFGGGMGQISGYSIALTQLEQLDEQLGQKMSYQYNRYDNKVYIETEWSNFVVGNYLAMEVYLVQDFATMYGDSWLDRYYVALVRKQWGTNLGKYQNVTLLNGITYNGGQIYDQAMNDIKDLEEQLKTHYSLPAIGLIY